MKYFLLLIFFCKAVAFEIDVVIPCISKDLKTLELCIKGIRKYGKDVRRIIVVSPTRLTNSAEWFPERNYPFSIRDVVIEIFNGDIERAESYLKDKNNRSGWFYQQLLKLYAPFVIPGISSNVLMLDADTIFLNRVEFMTDWGEPLYNVGTEYHKPYFAHAKRLLPGFKKVFQEYSGIVHHMLFQKSVLEDLFRMIEGEPWKAICHCVDKNEIFGSFFSEYELYFNYVFLHAFKGKIRSLKCKNVRTLKNLKTYKKQKFVYVSCHTWTGKD